MPGKYFVTPIRERHYPVYRYRDLLAAVGSDQDVRDLLVSYGYEGPPLSVIRGWRTRNSIPSRWLPIIMHKLMSEGDLRDPAVLLEKTG
jgi:hypothetical protein